MKHEQEPAPQPEMRQPPKQPPAVDVQRLAEKVYELMRADLRLDHARGARPARRREP